MINERICSFPNKYPTGIRIVNTTINIAAYNLRGPIGIYFTYAESRINPLSRPWPEDKANSSLFCNKTNIHPVKFLVDVSNPGILVHR